MKFLILRPLFPSLQTSQRQSKYHLLQKTGNIWVSVGRTPVNLGTLRDINIQYLVLLVDLTQLIQGGF